jgi:5'(3')-deoxyribonucleotidase
VFSVYRKAPERYPGDVKRIAIDMDEVMADTFQHCLNLYNAEFGQELTPECFDGRHLFEVIAPEHRDHVATYFDRHDFFAGIAVMEGAFKVVRELSERYEVFVVSAAMDVPSSFAAKFQWLQRHFPFIASSHIVFCGDKSIVLADYLIDDNIRQLNAFQGEGILFHAPHNVGETRYRRVRNWNEVRDLFLVEHQVPVGS